MWLNMIVEGQTEQIFARDVIGNYLTQFEIYVAVRRVRTGAEKGRIRRGGMTTYAKAQNDIKRWMKQNKGKNFRFTTMFDLYGLPNDFPGFSLTGKSIDPYKRIEALEYAFGEDIRDERFVPYIQLYEFETLLFADPQKFETMFIRHTAQIENLKKTASLFSSPELINDGSETSPSKRIIKEIPDYRNWKSTAGPNIAKAIGLNHIRKKCPHFDKWIIKLESLRNTES